MTKKVRKNYRNMRIESGDDFDDLFADDFDPNDLDYDVFSSKWSDYGDSEQNSRGRKKRERSRDGKRFYSQLDEWSEFGLNSEYSLY